MQYKNTAEMQHKGQKGTITPTSELLSLSTFGIGWKQGSNEAGSNDSNDFTNAWLKCSVA